MLLDKFLAELEALAQSAREAFRAAVKLDALEALRIRFLGAKKGELKDVQKGLGKVDQADKPAAGKRLNEVKTLVQQEFEAAKHRLTTQVAAADQRFASVPDQTFDPTIPGKRPVLGHDHPITQTIEAIKDIFARLAFNVVEGPEIEDEWHNFIALNIPESHPARDPLDNFYLATGVLNASGDFEKGPGSSDHHLLLRSQTSTVQIRVMENTPPPGPKHPAIRIISLGRVYRPDDVDKTHYPMFHQIEGLLVDCERNGRHVTMADLKSVLRMFCSSYLGSDVHIRFRPSFFPFTEPSVEVDMSWEDGWIEMGGAGMVDPNVLEAVGYDPEEVSGFAFGLGVERLSMRRYGIDDIREFFKNDVRFLQQF